MRQKKILVISGDPILVDLLQKNLSSSGYQVVSVEGATGEVDTLLKEGQPDLVIVDIMFPKMDGIRVSLNIRKKYDVPIIMLTSRMAEKDNVRGLDLNTEDHLSSLVDIVQLMDWIKETFARNAAMNYYHPDINGNGNGKKKIEDF